MLWSASKSLSWGGEHVLDLQSEAKLIQRGRGFQNNFKKALYKPFLSFALLLGVSPVAAHSLHGLGGFAGSFNPANPWKLGGQAVF